MSNLHRRHFLALAAMGCPLSLGMKSMVENMVLRSIASNNAEVRNYVYMIMTGGPVRWMFDQSLKINDSDKMISNKMVGTEFKTGLMNPDEIDLKYAVSRQGKYLMPTMWKQDLGKGRVMSELLPNMMTFRGINSGMDGHQGNRAFQIAPLKGGPSLNGLVADASKKVIPAVDMNSNLEDYRAPGKTGVAKVRLKQDQTLVNLMSPFISKGNAIRGEKTMNDFVEEALGYYQELSGRAMPVNKSLYKNRRNAESLLRKGAEGLVETFQQLFMKYKMVVETAMRSEMKGVNDQQIMGDSRGPNPMYKSQIGANGGENFLAQDDLRDVFKGGTNLVLVSHLAVTEFLLMENYSSSLSLSAGNLQGLNLKNSIGGGNINKASLVHDTHRNGAVSTLMAYTQYYKGVSAGIYELIENLKTKNLFDETVIQLSGDFTRTPKKDGSGSDHGWQAGCTSIFSGAIKEHTIIGSICEQSSVKRTQKNYPGTFGEGAKSTDLGGSHITPGHVASSIAHILRVTSPKPNVPSIVQENSSGISSMIEPAKTVEA